MNVQGLIIGGVAFVIIGVFHPIVIKTEYYWGTKVWPLFLVAGCLCLLASLFLTGAIASACLGVLGFSCLWSIGELREQGQRVAKGWFPKNPRRHYDAPDSAP